MRARKSQPSASATAATASHPNGNLRRLRVRTVSPLRSILRASRSKGAAAPRWGRQPNGADNVPKAGRRRARRARPLRAANKGSLDFVSVRSAAGGRSLPILRPASSIPFSPASVPFFLAVAARGDGGRRQASRLRFGPCGARARGPFRSVARAPNRRSILDRFTSPEEPALLRPSSRSSRVLFHLAGWVALAAAWLPSAAPQSVTNADLLFDDQKGPNPNFERAPLQPLELSADGQRLYAINAPGARLAAFDVASGQHVLDIPIGIGPVAVARRPGGDQLWVVDELASSVFVVQASTASIA